MSNIHGLFSRKNGDSDDDDDNESNNRFVGGIDSRGGGSGLAVQPNEADRDAVFSMAEAGGADEPARRTIIMYRDGFVVDDGPFRRLDDPANAEFLRSLAQGRTPRELVGEGDVTVGLVDKRNQDYVEEFRTFSGTGNTLGSANSGGVLDPTTLPAPGVVDESRPTTSIAVRLMGGGRRVVRINLDATVMDLAAHLNDATGPFTLVAGFPPKPLTDFSSSIEDAGLKGAQVMQKEGA